MDEQTAEAWALIERLRAEGWLVVVKAMPEGFPFFLDEEHRHKMHARYVCDLSWMPRRDNDDARRYINLHAWGRGQTLLEAVHASEARMREQQDFYKVKPLAER